MHRARSLNHMLCWELANKNNREKNKTDLINSALSSSTTAARSSFLPLASASLAGGAGDVVRGDWGGSLSGDEGVLVLLLLAPGDGGGGDSDGEGEGALASVVGVATAGAVSAASEAMSSTRDKLGA